MVALLLVAGAALAVPTVGAATPAASSPGPPVAAAGETAGDGLHVNYTTSLTPARPGEVNVTARFAVPDRVTALGVAVPPDATVTAAEGFRQRGPGRYEWTRTTDRPSLAYRLPANVTVARGREGAATSGYLYVDTGEWALVRAPSLGVTYSGAGPRPPLRRSQSVAGEGVAGDALLFLGPVETETRTVAGQRLRLAVPAAADLRESPTDVLDSLAGAARTLRVGPADESVLVVAAPTAGVDYGSTGLQRGAADAWVRDTERLDSPENVWVHEYVHTRQAYRGTDATRWTFEGMADYYAVTRALEAGRINYSRYRRHLNIGARQRYANATLADPSTWTGTTAHYWKGALAFAAIDRRIRVESGGDATLQDAIRRATNTDERVDQSRFLDAVAATGGPDSRALARELTETSAAAETWNRSVHARVFGLADPDYRFASFRVAGPYRNATVDRLPTLVPGERVTVRAVARNNGTETGDYAVTLRAGDRAVGTRTGRLDPGETARFSWTVPFDAAGESRLVLGEATRPVTVRQAAAARVTALRVPARVGVGESVRVRATVGNRAGRPAGATVALRADGATLTERRVRLAPGASTALAGRTAFQSPGEYTVAAGDRTATVRVVAGTPTPTAPDDGDDFTGTVTPTPSPVTPTVAQGPGFGIAAAVAAVAFAVLLGRRRRNR
jgi:hypothetical protein